MAKSCPMCDSTNLVKGDCFALSTEHNSGGELEGPLSFGWKGKKIPEISVRSPFGGGGRNLPESEPSSNEGKRYTTGFPPSQAAISAVGCKSCGHISLVASKLTTYDSRVEKWEDSPIVKERRAEAAEAEERYQKRQQEIEIEDREAMEEREKSPFFQAGKRQKAERKESEIAKLKDRIKKLEKE